VDGIVEGSREIEKRLWIIRLGLWDFRKIGAKEIRHSDMDWIKLAMDSVEHVLLRRRWEKCDCANYLD
jgi:hypothetical protein